MQAHGNGAPAAHACSTRRAAPRVALGLTLVGLALAAAALAWVPTAHGQANQPPTATGGTFTTTEDAALSFHLAASDPEGGALTYAITTAPATGSLAPTAGGAAGDYTFTPNADTCTPPTLPDGLQFTVTDPGGATSTPAAVTLHVTCVDDAPSFTGGADVTTVAWTGTPPPLTTTSGWATGIQVGGGENQRIRFTVTAGLLPSGASLFAGPGGVDPYVLDNTGAYVVPPASAALVFRAGDGRQGIVPVTVCLQDDGITSGDEAGPGSVDTSPCANLRIVVQGPPVTQPDTYPVYTGIVTSPKTSVLANDANFDGHRPPTAVLASSPSNAFTFTLRSDGTFDYQPFNYAVVPPATSATDSFQYQADDGYGHLSAPETVLINIEENDPPLAAFTADAQTVVGKPLAFTDTSSDPEGDLVAWSWSFGDGDTTSQQNPVHQYSAQGTYDVILTITDGGGKTDASTLHVTVDPAPSTTDTGSREPPEVTAGNDLEARSGDHVEMHGLAKPAMGISVWDWQQVAGPHVALAGSHGPDPSFTAPAVAPGSVALLNFTVTVYDGVGGSAPDAITVRVRAANSAPVFTGLANRTAAGGTRITLGAPATDPDGDVMVTRWAQLSGPRVSIRDANTRNATAALPDLAAPQDVVLRFEAGDGRATMAANVTLHIAASLSQVSLFDVEPGTPGVAQIVAHATEPHEGDSYAWSFGDGANGTGRDVTHTYAKNGRYTVSLTVTDAAGITSKWSQPVNVLGATPTTPARPATGDAKAPSFGPWMAFAGIAVVGAVVGLVVFARSRSGK